MRPQQPPARLTRRRGRARRPRCPGRARRRGPPPRWPPAAATLARAACRRLAAACSCRHPSCTSRQLTLRWPPLPPSR
eukprot:353535-Chlamydomonas_euryale.AAC.6